MKKGITKEQGKDERYEDLITVIPPHESSRLCLVPGKCERKKIGRKNEKKEKGKESNINFFACLVTHEKFKGKKRLFSFVWLTMKKKSKKNERKIKSIICLYQFIE